MRIFDNTYLGDGIIFTTDMKQTGLNNNELIIGGTGTGKTTSFVEPKLLHAKYASYIIPLSKRKLAEQYIPYMRKNGYQIYDLNFANPYRSSIGFDVFDFLHGEEDFRWLANELTRNATIEEFWNHAACSVLLAEMMYLYLTNEELSVYDLVTFHNQIRLDTSRSLLHTSVDEDFLNLQNFYPDNVALCGWNEIHNSAPKTAASIFQIVTSCLQIFAGGDLLELSTTTDRLDIKKVGRVKTALFITTSPIDDSVQKYVNLFYSVLFRELFKEAEKQSDYQLPVPVHVICDDFACGIKIPNFTRYISVFRATGISVTILLQSESQLSTLYGENEASTIINNCDTLVYTGGQDIESCKHFSMLTNKPFEDILWMGKDEVIIVRRGNRPVFTKRYATYMDELYKTIA